MVSPGKSYDNCVWNIDPCHYCSYFLILDLQIADFHSTSIFHHRINLAHQSTVGRTKQNIGITNIDGIRHWRRMRKRCIQDKFRNHVQIKLDLRSIRKYNWRICVCMCENWNRKIIRSKRTILILVTFLLGIQHHYKHFT